jgi:hypothetical protein
MNPLNTTSSTPQKLSLKKETLRRLTSPELQLAVGGVRHTTNKVTEAGCCYWTAFTSYCVCD